MAPSIVQQQQQQQQQEQQKQMFLCIQEYPKPGDVMRYYSKDLTVCYTGVMVVNGNIYEVDKMYNHNPKRFKIYKNLELWMSSLGATVNELIINHRLVPHQYYDAPLLPRENMEDNSRFVPGDIIRLYPDLTHPSFYYEGVITYHMQVYEVSYPEMPGSLYDMYQTVGDYLQTIDENLSLDNIFINQVMHDDSIRYMGFEVQELEARVHK